MFTFYFRRPDDGAVSIVETTDPNQAPPAGFEQITEEEYRAGLAGLSAAHAAMVADQAAADDVNQAADFEALTGAGVAVETARRISGYGGRA